MSHSFPTSDMAVTHLLVVSDVSRSKRWYRDVLGAKEYREYGASAVLDFNGTWLLLVEGGDPTPDKPDVTFSPPNPQTVSHSFTVRVEDCRASYETLKSRGADFLTPPHDRGREVRCFFRDPDGHLWEISQLEG